MFKKFFPLLALACLLVSVTGIVNAQQASGVSTIIITRHAEKENGGSDPDLSAAGKARAAQLAALLKDVPVTKLLSTPYKRTRQTLEPIATTRGLTIDPYDASKLQGLQELAKTLKESKDQTIVIAGHSNSAPELVNLLLNDQKYSQLSEDDFSKIWLLTLQSGNVISCVMLNSY
jgi:2,3-bisphosphoglycerate-dependent phosphoglycerate mutase